MNKQVNISGELVSQTMAMPANTNENGDIFGGWLLSQMDLGGAILARDFAKSRITTIAIDSMVFRKPVHVGDVLTCYAEMQKIGRTSMQIKMEAWVTRKNDGEPLKVTEGVFTYVAIDKDGKPRAADPSLR